MIKKIFLFSFIIVLNASPGFSEEFFRITVLDSFDSADGWTVAGSRRNSYNAYVYSGRLENPADSESGKYLAFSLKGDAKTGFRARKTPPYELKGCVNEIQLSVFGTGRNIRLFLDLEDIQGKFIRVPAANLNFTGWKKITVPVRAYRSRRMQLSRKKDGLSLTGLFFTMDASEKTAEILLDNLSYSGADCVKDPCGEEISSCL